MQQAILISAAILVYILVTQYGRRRLSWLRLLPAIVGIPVATVIYLAKAPGHSYDVYLYLVAAAVGCAFGALTTVTTRLERDRGNGRLYTRSGLAYAATWAVAMGTRVALIWALQDWAWFQHAAGPFMRDHEIGRDAIAAAFVLMAVTMYGFRYAAIAVQARRLPRSRAAGDRAASPATTLADSATRKA
jgi:hypothetical protein